MKKIFKILMTIIFSTTTTGSIIACSNPFADPNVIRITIVTDGHPINDKSFNESSLLGAIQFQEEFEQWTNRPEELKNKKIVITPIMPTTIDENTFVQSYGQSVVMTSAVTVASGFVQKSSLVRAQNQTLKNLMRYIYVDGDTEDDIVASENKNLAGLLYNAEQSGLMAAIAGAVWLIAHANEYGGFNNLKMSTYGGLNIPSVTNYMYGFFWGLYLVNESKNLKPEFNQQLKDLVKILNSNFDVNNDLPTIKFVDLPNQFTGNFNQASTSSKAINTALVSAGTNIIFPVAGPQTSDTLSALEAKGNGKVIGVDTDQQLQYGESADRFITSALKNIVGSVNYMMWRAIGYDETPQHNKLSESEMDEIFKTNAPYRGGSDFVGIAKNSAIAAIYDGIINNTNLIKDNGFLDQVSQGWQKVLKENHNDLWNTGKDINPFILSALNYHKKDR
ncbi:MAG: BMP family ABC transporter substrate-binding protein [Spiroplasma sp.]|nr:BMP family ABC transporter substrate-binding protein [Spiroplasma sp.]